MKTKKHECPEFSSQLGADSGFNYSLEDRGDGWYLYAPSSEHSKLRYLFCPICGEKLEADKVEKDAAEMNDKELNAFCDKLGLTSADWDEGGGFVHEAVVRVVQKARQEAKVV